MTSDVIWIGFREAGVSNESQITREFVVPFNFSYLQPLNKEWVQMLHYQFIRSFESEKS